MFEGRGPVLRSFFLHAPANAVLSDPAFEAPYSILPCSLPTHLVPVGVDAPQAECSNNLESSRSEM